MVRRAEKNFLQAVDSCGCDLYSLAFSPAVGEVECSIVIIRVLAILVVGENANSAYRADRVSPGPLIFDNLVVL